ncbi:MAG: cell division protein ZapA [Dysgonomonas sp.]
MDEHFIITLRVFDKMYRVRIRRKDEKIYRDAADAIEKKTNQYRNSFSGVVNEPLRETDYMVMTAIQALSENVDLEIKNETYEDKIRSLTEELNVFLKKYR